MKNDDRNDRLLAKGGTMLGTARVHPDKLRAGLDQIKETLDDNGIDVLIPIGGEGTLTAAHWLSQENVPVIGVPKTIDNDIDCTDVTFGHDTALTVATDAIDRLHSTAESHQRVMLVEVMGRHAGWIALNAGLASGAHMTLIPEQPFDVEEVCRLVKRRFQRGDSHFICVVAEGAKPVEGSIALREGGLDEFGHEKFTGVAAQLGLEVEKRINKDVRVTVLGHVQRGGSPTAYDRVLATRFGVNAADAAHAGSTGRWCRCAGRTSGGWRWATPSGNSSWCPRAATTTPRPSSADTGRHPLGSVSMTVAGAELLDYDEVIERFDPVLGLEVHVELSTATKMFCGCATAFGAEPNTQVCPVCLGLPGSLPVLNQVAVESAIRIGLALNCEIVPWCRFARKNYFYPDMPKNYQISQYDEPIAINGYLDAPLEDGTTWRVEIERAHMEEDTGKLTHIGSETGRIHGATTSLIDYNRAGVPLIEIVTKPIVGAGDRAPQIARAYVTALRDLLRSLEVSDVRMDQGSMRCDSNVSLMAKGAAEFGTRTETKNVNSLKSVEVAVRYEMQRQAAVLLAGGQIVQETRHFHEAGYTSPGRAKETAQDYRYFPEPDLEPVAPSRELVEQLRQTIPELPWLSRKRIQDEWGISDEVMRDLVNAGAVELVAETVKHGAASREARSWWGNFLVQKANEAGIGLDELPITPAQVAAVIALVDQGKLSNKLAREVVEGVLAGEGEPAQVMSARGLELVRDDSVTQAAVDEALAANPDVAEKIRGGKVAAAGAIVGAVMKATRGQADAARVRELVLAACGQA